MRDELVDALQFTLDDVSVSRVLLEGEGPAFSAGGDLDEFGTATDLAQAHVIRTSRSPALLVHCQRAKVRAHLQGACVGAGIEIPAAGGHVEATGDAWFRLPEIGMGLIPGAGGTVSIPRRIGRHRTLWWALQDLRLDARDGVGVGTGRRDRAGGAAMSAVLAQPAATGFPGQDGRMHSLCRTGYLQPLRPGRDPA